MAKTVIHIALILIATCLLYFVLKTPFSYPYFIHQFDVSGKRSPHIDDYLDDFLIYGGFAEIRAHQKVIEQWKVESQKRVGRSILKKYRRKQYKQALDDENGFKFCFMRTQTRYRQRNYIKTAYKVYVQVNCFTYDYGYIKDRYDQLDSIGFECTLRRYHSKSQRRLMTRELREMIMIRDNYTCQLCGKYMPDEVGLQIDHIIPVAKGGKTIPSNLQVLCSKCNGSKSNKTSFC